LIDKGITLDPKLIEAARFLRYICGVVAIDVNVTVNVNEVQIDIFSRDSTNPAQPQSHYGLAVTNTSEFLAERWDSFTVSTPNRRIVTRVKQIIEFIPRPGNDSDPDYLANGFDGNGTKDTIVRIHDMEVNGTTNVFEDLGELALFTDPNNDSDTTGVFRRAFRVVTLFAPLKIARLCVGYLTTNIRNSIGSGEVVRPGDVGFNILIDNIPWTRDDTVLALAIDHDVDIDDNTVLATNGSGWEVDP